eukprot:5627916-Prymnesium_polylepis.1
MNERNIPSLGTKTWSPPTRGVLRAVASARTRWDALPYHSLVRAVEFYACEGYRPQATHRYDHRGGWESGRPS